MARLGRFERPTSGSGDQRSIQLSYRRAENSNPTYFVILSCPLGLRQCAALRLARSALFQPLDRDLISLASFSISSAFLISAKERTWEESVFSTSSFSSLAS
jgi:hypothetical protein